MSATQTQKINKRLEALKQHYNYLKKEYLDDHHAEIYGELAKIAKMQYAKTPECAQFQEEFYQDYFTYNWKSRYHTTIQEDRLIKLREKAIAAGKKTPETEKPEENAGKNTGKNTKRITQVEINITRESKGIYADTVEILTLRGLLN